MQESCVEMVIGDAGYSHSCARSGGEGGGGGLDWGVGKVMGGDSGGGGIGGGGRGFPCVQSQFSRQAAARRLHVYQRRAGSTSGR